MRGERREENREERERRSRRWIKVKEKEKINIKRNIERREKRGREIVLI